MTSNIKGLLDKLGLEDNGRFENHFYIINLADSDEYAKMYTKLEKNAINTENPSFGTNSNNTTTIIRNYFEAEDANVSYNIFLIANFDTDEYKIKIGEK